MDRAQKNTPKIPKTLGLFFLHFMKKQRIAFIFFFIAPVVVVVENNVIPYALKMIVDALGADPYKKDVFRAVTPALCLGGGAWLFMLSVIWLQNWWQGHVVPMFQADVLMSLFEYVNKQSHQYFASQMAGSLGNKINELPRALEAIFMLLTWYVVAAFASIIVALILMCTIDYWFAVVLSSWIVFQLVVSYKLSKKVDSYSNENAEDKSVLNGKIVDSLSNISVVKLFARGKDEFAYVSESQNKEKISNKRLILYLNIFRLYLDIPVTIMLTTMGVLLIIFWEKSLISTGELVFIFNVSFVIMTQIWYLCHAISELIREIGIARQAIALLSVPIEIQDIPGAKPLQVSLGKIEFQEVTFHYSKGKKIFENKSVIIEPGQRVGLVGFSGSGKTTFIHLILRFYNVDSGRILIDGQDISLVTQDSLHEAISMIPQDTTLFHRTLKENILYGNLNATDEAVYEAARKACCDQFISLLPDGYDTLVGERGARLSGGQRQRIAIARAMLKESKILILDEATSALDSLTEGKIQNSLWCLMENKTTIVIAHRLSTLLHMDRILVFEHGKIVEDGTHNELIAKNGLYKAKWDAQVGGNLTESDKEGWDD